MGLDSGATQGSFVITSSFWKVGFPQSREHIALCCFRSLFLSFIIDAGASVLGFGFFPIIGSTAESVRMEPDGRAV